MPFATMLQHVKYDMKYLAMVPFDIAALSRTRGQGSYIAAYCSFVSSIFDLQSNLQHVLPTNPSFNIA